MAMLALVIAFVVEWLVFFVLCCYLCACICFRILPLFDSHLSLSFSHTHCTLHTDRDSARDGGGAPHSGRGWEGQRGDCELVVHQQGDEPPVQALHGQVEKPPDTANEER